MAKVRVTVTAFNADGYHKDILVMDEDQIRQSDVRVGESIEGPSIRPADFPEVDRFVVTARAYGK